MKKNLIFVMSVIAFCLFACLMSCSDDPDSNIVGKWGNATETVTFSKNGDYRYENTSGGFYQYRKGRYTYNKKQNLLVVNIDAVAGNNGAYTDTYLVQTLNSSSLVLIDVETGSTYYYTKK